MSLLKDKISQKEREAQAVNYFISKGWTKEQAIGIVGNLAHESNLNSVTEGDIGYKGGSSFGIAQFRGDRLKKLQNRYGDKWQDFQNQLEYVDWELNNTEKPAGDALRITNNINDAGRVVSDLYERPKVKFYQDKNRQAAVAKIYQRHADTPATEWNITPDLTNLPQSKETDNFVEEEKVPEPPKEVAAAKTELTQKQQELNFLQDYTEGKYKQQPVAVVAEEPSQDLPEPDIAQEYGQIEQFIDNPLFQKGGVVKAYNPKLANDENFQNWYKQNTIEGKNNTPYLENGDYDYLSFFMNGEAKNYKGGHFPDRYKRPNHETFSIESIYSIPENTGGTWNGEIYIPVKQQGGVIENNRGQWDFPGEITKINSGSISMLPDPITGKPINFSVLGIDNLGNQKLMHPGQQYEFPGNTVMEYPMLPSANKNTVLKKKNK